MMAASRTYRPVLLRSICGASVVVRAQLPPPTMAVSVVVKNDQDYDPAKSGAQSQFIYTVLSNSPTLGGVNAMINFTIPAGTNDTIYKTTRNSGFSGWNSSMNATPTVVRRSSAGMPPNSSGTLTVYCDSPHIRLGYATAESIRARGGARPIRSGNGRSIVKALIAYLRSKSAR